MHRYNTDIMKNLRNISLIAILLISMGSVRAQKYFKVLDATSSSFAGGTPISGSGTTYVVKVVLLCSQKIIFHDIWVNNEYGNPETLSASYSDGRALSKGDTVLIRYTIHHYPANSPMQQIPQPEYKKPPIPIQGEALLGFIVGNATRYRSVGKFKDQGFQNYP